MLRVGFLCSGALGLQTLKALNRSLLPQFIFTDKNSVDIIEFAGKHSIPIFVGNPRKNVPSSFLKIFDTDIIFSINYLFIVEENIMNHPRLYAINFHGSLLPKYRGRTPHVWAIINGEKETGITAHIMEKGCDTGDILSQKKIEIQENDTGANILERYKAIYPQMVEELIEKIEGNSIKRVKQDNTKATYFGKRTPGDGQINWNWQKERIRNWVRAQADPYPGAFTKINNSKLTINQIRFTEHGYDESMPNGLILATNPKIMVKTPNGVVELTKTRENISTTLKPNDKFDSPCI
ncbi:MAG: hypothetical protein A2W90_16670 [Bacteroidetes bacterium GWF2_42_66]|nr:MAG: hypothetical protein A2W92_03945 [Bacteroidetes bacterium GWA2_42_15]OFX96327.1 MAG: hypothetical protein A2W89_05600 [Bacteroidetes bacterium GWE2_42_39]OFY46366.1 MAG: hypothetical protein A2W90_16670 [Bacteroidetes bacterium GWF2_42_66]HBL78247.1 hypothetical protein [Prolixibacteraceae bacterium]HCU60147.1 hypothetical protein [Prolixibacteraceae bacterium]